MVHYYVLGEIQRTPEEEEREIKAALEYQRKELLRLQEKTEKKMKAKEAKSKAKAIRQAEKHEKRVAAATRRKYRHIAKNKRKEAKAEKQAKEKTEREQVRRQFYYFASPNTALSEHQGLNTESNRIENINTADLINFFKKKEHLEREHRNVTKRKFGPIVDFIKTFTHLAIRSKTHTTSKNVMDSFEEGSSIISYLDEDGTDLELFTALETPIW